MNIYRSGFQQVRLFSSFTIEPELRENKRVADLMIKEVRSRIKHCGTKGIKYPPTHEKLREFREVNETIGKMRDLREKIYHEQSIEKQNAFVSYDIGAYLAKKSECGNCGEMSSVGLMYLVESEFQDHAAAFQVVRPEEAGLPEGVTRTHSHSHTFVVVGSASHAVVADAFNEEESYPLVEMGSRLKNYYGLDEKARPQLALIDPTIDKINFKYSNIFSLQEFVEPFLNYGVYEIAKDEVKDVAYLLNCFNTSESKKDKLIKANEIINKAIPLLNKVDSTILKVSQFLNEHEGRLLEIINTPKDQMNPSTIEEGLVTASVHYRQLHLCKDNVYSLISQLDKFKHPNKLSFDLQLVE